MPLEIRELVVRARVDPGADPATSALAAPPAEGRTGEQRLIETCVREVLRILEEKRER